MRIWEISSDVVTKTRDDVFVTLTAVVMYQVMPSDVYHAFYALSSPQKQIKANISDVLRANVPQLSLDELLVQGGACWEGPGAPDGVPEGLRVLGGGLAHHRHRPRREGQVRDEHDQREPPEARGGEGEGRGAEDRDRGQGRGRRRRAVSAREGGR